MARLRLEDVQPAVNAIAEATKNCSEDQIIGACIVTAVMVQNPYATLDQIYEAVTQTSSFIADLVGMHIKEINPTQTPKRNVH